MLALDVTDMFGTSLQTKDKFNHYTYTMEPNPLLVKFINLKVHTILIRGVIGVKRARLWSYLDFEK